MDQFIDEKAIKDMKEPPSFLSKSELPGGKALILASKTVYTDAKIKKVIQHIEQHLFFDVKETIAISFDFENDIDAVRGIIGSDVDQVILVHEVWQPPIRGLLYYISQIKAAMPQDKSLYILLTQNADQEDLAVGDKDIDFQVWKKAVLKLEDPDIMVKRFL